MSISISGSPHGCGRGHVSRAARLAVIVVAGAPLLGLVAMPRAGAAPINHGTFMGTHVTYVGVTEESGTDPLPPAMFGPPTVTGNSMDFNPVGFDASVAGAGSDTTVGNLAFMVTAKSGSRIQSITLNQTGETTLGGNVAPGSMGTASATFASGSLDIHEVDFQGINHVSVPFSMTFTPSGGTYFLGTDGGGGPIFNTQYNGSVSLPVADILTANGFTGGATKVSIDLDSTLQAVGQAGTSATISATDFGGLAVRTAVVGETPEPTALALGGLAAGGLLLGRRRSPVRR